MSVAPSNAGDNAVVSVGTVAKKKRRRMDEDGQVVVLTQDSSMSSNTGVSLFDVSYIIGNALSQDIE